MANENLLEEKWNVLSKAFLILLSIVLVSFLANMYYKNDIKRLQDKSYTHKSKEIIEESKLYIETKQANIANITYLLSLNSNVKNVLLNNQKDQFSFDQVLKGFHNIEEYENVKIQIIDKNGITQYKSWKSSLNTINDILEIIKEPKIMNHITTDQTGLVFKSIVPIYEQELFIGVIEVTSNFSSVVNHLTQNNNKSIISISSVESIKINQPSTTNFIDESYIITSKDSLILNEFLKYHGINKFINIPSYIVLQDYMVVSHPIKNKNRTTIAYNVNFYDKHYMDNSIIDGYKKDFLFNIIIILISLLILISIFVLSKYIKNLRLDIRDKNNDLEIQNNKLIDLVKSYDENVIYSKTDIHGVITDVSKAFCEISGYLKEELIGKSHNIVRHTDMYASVFKDIWNTIKADEVWEGDIKNIRKDGSYYWTRAVIRSDIDSYGNLLGYYAIRHDITALKDFEEQQKYLIQSEKLASMGEMIGNIAHQWRQPLSIISTAATGIQLQKEHNLLTDEFFDKSCRLIDDNTQYLSKTIDDFRNFLKGNSIKQRFQLDHTMDSFMNLVRPSIKDHNILVEMQIEKEMDIISYENELIQCLINIFNNAKDAFLEDHNKTISTKKIIISAYKIDTHMIITIQDNAGGIPEKIIDKVFEPYFTTKNQSQGTGLGLHMSYKLISELMLGTITVVNKSYFQDKIENKGAFFSLTIPL